MSILTSILLSLTILTSNNLTKNANISVMVRNITTGEVIDTMRQRQVVPPASVMKLLTTGAALETLGPSFRFKTALEYSGYIEGGILHGNLYVRGGCDPSLGNRKSNQAFWQKWVNAVKDLGIHTIDGSIVADMTMLDGDAVNPGWLWEDAGNYYAPGIFAINYMNNTLNIILRSGVIGSLAEVIRTEPEYPGLIYNNHIRCTEIECDGAYVHGMPYSKERYLTGSIPFSQGQFGVQSDMPNPGWLVASTFTLKLNETGITVNQPARYISEKSSYQSSRTEFYTHLSDSLGALIAEANTYSNNLYAETIFRYLGTLYSIPGTVNNSCNFIRDFWRAHGVDVAGAHIKDGCGLAPQDAISATTLVQLLTYMDKSKYADIWHQTLAVSGKTGTLRSFLNGTMLQGRVQAKSGTIAGTKNYAGYMQMPNGDTWVFAVLVNSAQGKYAEIKNVIERYLLDVYKTHQ